MYSVADYGRMFADEGRMPAYVDALVRHVKPGSVVVDLGAGTGIFSLIACKLGARKVYAIETNDAIRLLPGLARENGVSDRIQIFQAPSTELSLPERADVLVSDLRGVLPLMGRHLPSIVDARTRLLAPGGVLIPQQDTLFAAVVEAGPVYQKLVSPWERAPFDLSMAGARASVVNATYPDRDIPMQPEQLVTTAQAWAVLDYRTLESPSVTGHAHWQVESAREAHGLAIWFEATIDDEAGYSTAPGNELVYSRLFLPFPAPLSLAAHDEVSVELGAQWTGEDYTWGWTTRVTSPGATSPRVHHRQSTFLGAPASLEHLRRELPTHRPQLGAAGEADRDILRSMDGAHTMAEIAEHVRARHPQVFANQHEALAAVRRLTRRHAR